MGPLKRKKSALRRNFHRYQSNDNKEAYLTSAKLFHLTILKLKQDHWKQYLTDLDDKNLFNAARFTDGPSPPSFIPPLRAPNGTVTSDPSEQADLLFAGTSGPTTTIDLSDIPPNADRPRSSASFTAGEASHVINGLKPSKAPGPDKIPSKVLQLGGSRLASCIANIANGCLDLGYFPTQWKIAKSVILKKVGKPDYSNPGAYRPIALLNTLSKAVEAMIANRVKSYVEQNQLLNPGHYGGRQRRSTTVHSST